MPTELPRGRCLQVRAEFRILGLESPLGLVEIVAVFQAPRRHGKPVVVGELVGGRGEVVVPTARLVRIPLRLVGYERCLVARM